MTRMESMANSDIRRQRDGAGRIERPDVNGRCRRRARSVALTALAGYLSVCPSQTDRTDPSMTAHLHSPAIDPVKLDRLAEVAVKVGLQLQPGQDLLLTAP